MDSVEVRKASLFQNLGVMITGNVVMEDDDAIPIPNPTLKGIKVGDSVAYTKLKDTRQTVIGIADVDGQRVVQVNDCAVLARDDEIAEHVPKLVVGDIVRFPIKRSVTKIKKGDRICFVGRETGSTGCWPNHWNTGEFPNRDNLLEFVHKSEKEYKVAARVLDIVPMKDRIVVAMETPCCYHRNDMRRVIGAWPSDRYCILVQEAKEPTDPPPPYEERIGEKA